MQGDACAASMVVQSTSPQSFGFRHALSTKMQFWPKKGAYHCKNNKFGLPPKIPCHSSPGIGSLSGTNISILPP
jgi:hypothetical protein